MLEVLSSDDMQVCISCANGAVKSSNFESVAEVMADDKIAYNFVTNKENRNLLS